MRLSFLNKPALVSIGLTLSFFSLSCAKPHYAPLTTNDVNRQGSADPACPISFNSIAACGQLTFNQNPTTENDSPFTLRIWSKTAGTAAGPYFDPESVDLNVVLWMPVMNHGSAKVVLNHSAAGVYDVSNVYFVMSGEWEVRVQWTQNGNVVDQAIVPANVN
jgi:hypothetical protein